MLMKTKMFIPPKTSYLNRIQIKAKTKVDEPTFVTNDFSEQRCELGIIEVSCVDLLYFICYHVFKLYIVRLS